MSSSAAPLAAEPPVQAHAAAHGHGHHGQAGSGHDHGHHPAGAHGHHGDAQPHDHSHASAAAATALPASLPPSLLMAGAGGRLLATLGLLALLWGAVAWALGDGP